MPDQMTIPPVPSKNTIYWLGQAGFWIDLGERRILIDPYLSDSLAKKYAGKKFPHHRMMPIPTPVEALPRPDVVLVTHAHTDHMDPETLGPFAQRHPDCPIVVPAASVETAKQRIGGNTKLQPVNTDDRFEPLPGLHILVFPAAHEERQFDNQGHDHFLGYGIRVNNTRLFHSGDTIPFSELSSRLQNYQPDIALLPVNGRDETRRGNGIPGNMTLTEAIDMCRTLRIPNLVPHHFGMFEFNTIDQAEIADAAKRTVKPEITCPTVMTPIGITNLRSVAKFSRRGHLRLEVK